MVAPKNIPTNTSLFDLLDFDPHDEESRLELDCDAIIKTIQNNPRSAEKSYRFTYGQRKCLPLHQAIKLRAPANVIDALPPNHAVPVKHRDGEIDLDLALHYKVAMDVLLLLLEKRPESILEKNKFGYNALHSACFYESPLEVVSLLLQTCPEALKEKDDSGYTPLHSACRCRAPLDVVSVLLDTWPDALRETDNSGYTPLHVACQYNAPVEVVSLLLNACPGASAEVTYGGYTPLHLSCRYRSPIKIISLLLEKYPEATKKRNTFGRTPLALARENNVLQDVQTLIALVPFLFHREVIISDTNEIMSFLIKINWRYGVLLLLDRYPDISKTMGLTTNVMADFLFTVGACCRLTAIWEVILNEQELLGGA